MAGPVSKVRTPKNIFKQNYTNALNKAANYLAKQAWSFSYYSNTFHDVQGTNEPDFNLLMNQEQLKNYVSNFTVNREDGVTGYELNDEGLKQLSLTFKNLGSGQLVASLYNKLQPENGGLSEQWLVSLNVAPVAFTKSALPRANNFFVSMQSMYDKDGGLGFGVGSLNISEGSLSLTQSDRYDAYNITSSGSWLLNA